MSNERNHQAEIPRTLHRYGGEAKKASDIGYALRAKGVKFNPNYQDVGRPDYVWLLPPRGGFLEVKGADLSFPFSLISDRQRFWLTYGPPEAEIVWPLWPRANYLWLTMGTARAGAKENGRRTWMVPWRDWMAMELRCREAGLKGLAYDTPHKLEHREAGLGACELLQAFELQWNYGAWTIPMGHQFWRPYFYPRM